ncbi:glycosyltransferase [Candidatus Bathyarchaeota archaeon]|nr:glycosyltransferase [Candidatus Bathyarchaeota archaeon]
MSEKEISILLPAYNEALRIEGCIRQVERAVRSFSGSYELIVAEDGSTDGTEKVVAELSQGNPRLSLLHSPARLGKGKAIKRALRSAKGDVVVFMDVDLATSLDYLPEIVKLTQAHRGMTIGSRHVKGAKVQRRVSRTLFSLTYNLFVRMLFLDGVHDHQCGFKAMSREVAAALLDKSMSDGFFFDTEMILWCRKLGFPVVEVGVEWAETRKEGGSAVRLCPDSVRLGLDLLKFRLNAGVS